MNFFTGGLGLILNIVSISYGVVAGKPESWFYASATGLLFAFTYLYVALNTIFDFDQRLYGWYSLFVAINSIPAGILCFGILAAIGFMESSGLLGEFCG